MSTSGEDSNTNKQISQSTSDSDSEIDVLIAQSISLQTLKVTSLIWLTLSVAILTTSIIYASLNVFGVSKSISLLVSLVVLIIGFILLFLLLNPQLFLSLRTGFRVGNLSERTVTRKREVYGLVSSEKVTETITPDSIEVDSLDVPKNIGLERISRPRKSSALGINNDKNMVPERNGPDTAGNAVLAPNYDRYDRYPKFRYSPTGRISTIELQLRRRFWPLVVLIVLELLFLVGMVALWLWPFLAVSNYVGLNDVMVEHVQISTTRIPHLMYAQVTIFNQDHQPSKTIECYITQGNKLLLQGDIITFAPWENSIGLHSGFKLTRLMGCHGGATLTDKDIIADLNGGEDGFFAMVQGKAWYSQLIQAQAYYSQPISFLANLPVGQKTQTFNVFTSPKGLSVMPSK